MQAHCNATLGCNFFSHYGRGDRGQEGDCRLHTSCDTVSRHCSTGAGGCRWGGADCSARCAVPSTRGGRLFCPGAQAGWVGRTGRCYFLCGGRAVVTTCQAGGWDSDTGRAFSCHQATIAILCG